jgi:hypothetical protein
MSPRIFPGSNGLTQLCSPPMDLSAYKSDLRSIAVASTGWDKIDGRLDEIHGLLLRLVTSSENQDIIEIVRCLTGGFNVFDAAQYYAFNRDNLCIEKILKIGLQAAEASSDQIIILEMHLCLRKYYSQLKRVNDSNAHAALASELFSNLFVTTNGVDRLVMAYQRAAMLADSDFNSALPYLDEALALAIVHKKYSEVLYISVKMALLFMNVSVDKAIILSISRVLVFMLSLTALLLDKQTSNLKNI